MKLMYPSNFVYTYKYIYTDFMSIHFTSKAERKMPAYAFENRIVQ